jgi:hypothetical protein
MELKAQPSRNNGPKEEFEKIIWKHGHYIILAKMNKSMRCTCVNPDTKEALPTCGICLGTSYPIEYERHKVRVRDFTLNPRAIQAVAMGNDIGPQKVYYFKANVEISEGHLIVEADWHLSKPKKIHEVYQANYIYRAMGLGGEVTFLTVGVDSAEPFVDRLSRSTFPGLKVIDE